MMLHVAVFGSGRGSNFNSILNSIQYKKLNAEIKVVVSNNSNAGILEIARNNNIPALHISQKQFLTENDFNSYLLQILEKYEINFIVLAGYMKIIHPILIQKYRNKIINIHPALIPSFCGKDMYGSKVHEAVINYGCKVTGVTVHLVDEEYDRGPIVMQRCVEVKNDDTPQSLAERVLKVEHEIYPEAIQLFAEDKISINNRKIIIKK
jgi:phosphoribosylglycinamide formyltransferase-1